MASTKVELVDELLKRPYSLERERIIKRARRGHYHDFETETMTPKVVLVKDLTEAGFDDLAARVREGEFDEEPSEKDLAALRREVGPDMFDAILGKKN